MNESYWCYYAMGSGMGGLKEYSFERDDANDRLILRDHGDVWHCGPISHVGLKCRLDGRNSANNRSRSVG